jgi:hypothetical protein
MMQAALDFTKAPDIAAAQARADVGIERAAVRADKASPDWTIKAADMLRVAACILHSKGIQTFTVEQLRELVSDALPPPPDLRAWGGATRRATGMGFIKRIPGMFAAATSSNMAPKPVYAKGASA